MKRVRFSFERNVRQSLQYIVDSRIYVFASVAIFFFSALFGFLFPSLLSSFDDILRELAQQTEGLNWFQLFLFIFKNNSFSALYALFLGFFFGIVPLFNALLNGAVLGYVAARVVPFTGFVGLWRLLPHGIFELPAIFIAIGLGIKFGASFFSYSPQRILLRRLSDSLQAFVYVILPLLLLAAIIEATLILFF
ncbi:MAG: stage II sporulation protein M [Nanoarchaeota archaeon]